MLPFNTFTIHELVGFVVSASLATIFYLIYFKAGRRLMDLLCANFIVTAAGLSLVAFLTDNLVPAGMSSWGWPDGPTADELAVGTLHIQRFAWVCGILMWPAQLHFVLGYCNHWNWLRRRIYLVYATALMVIPIVWTPWWFSARAEPAGVTSSWSVAIPWMPVPTAIVGLLFTVIWCTSNGYTLVLLYRRRRASRLPGPPTYPMLVLVGVFVQVVFGTTDLLLAVFDYNGISFIPIGATVMGILLAAALLQERVAADRLRTQLAREKEVLLESIRQPLMYFDRGLRLQWGNTYAARLAEVAAGPLVGRPAADFWSTRAGLEADLLQAALKEGESSQCEAAGPDGSTWIIYNAPIFEERESVLGVLVLAVDVTQIRWAEEVLRDFHGRMLATREEEQRRLAGDLHDSVAQSLSALHMAMTAEADDPAVPAASAETLRRLAASLQDLVQEVRRVCYDLYPPTLDHFGLCSAVEKIAEPCAALGVQCRIHCEDDVARVRFGRDVEIALFRIAQESISNAMKHGKAGRINVQLACEDGRLRLTVEDNGSGFDPKDVSRYGLGINTMRGRVRGLGGDISITSRPGRTRVDVCMPSHAAGTAPGSPAGVRT